jgi:hypothetical protein
MRVLTVAIVLLMSSALVPSFAEEEEGKSPVPNQPQMTPVQPERSPQQSEQSREQDRKSAEDVQVGRDWKAQGASSHAPGQPDTNSNQTRTGTSSSGTQDSGIAGDVTVREQAQKPASTTGTTSGTQDSGISGDVTVHEQEQKPASTTGTTKSR